MVIQVRRGNEVDFDPNKMLPGEWAVSLDTRYVRMCFSPGIVLRMATYEAFEADMAEIQSIMAEARTIEEAVARIQTEINDTAVVVEDYAILSKSYAVGGTGTRENEDVDNAKYYYEQSKHISQGGNGLVPLGTIAFENLPTEDILTNGMYNISNDFTSDERFIDGGGVLYGKGSNVYYTVNGLWDVLAASDVKGVKGEAEDTFRQGNVTITPENLGLGNVLPLLGNTDISTIADGTITGGLSAVNENLAKVNNNIINTPLASILVNLSTESDINNYYDTISNNMALDTKYTRYVNHSTAHSILGAGIFVLEGCITNRDYEWQRITSYSFDETIREFTRIKKAGVWYDWNVPVTNSDLAKLTANSYINGTSVDLKNYSSGNPYVAASDGYVYMACINANYGNIAISTSNNVVIGVIGNTSDNKSSYTTYVKKGMKLYPYNVTGTPDMFFYPLA